MVHRRELNGQPIVLGNHGALWGNALTYYDHETGSVWSQPTGEAIAGPLTGARLELIPSEFTLWGDWKAAHPDSWALNVNSFWTVFRLADVAIVVDFGDGSQAFQVSEVRQVGVANSVIGPDEVPVAVTVDPDADRWAVYSRRLDDRVVELGWDNGELFEIGGDGRWNPINGLSSNGGTQHLDKLAAFTSFPTDYITFFPDGSFWQTGGVVSTDEWEPPPGRQPSSPSPHLRPTRRSS